MSPWPHKPISSLGTVITGSTPKTSEEHFYGGNIPFVTPAELDQTDPIMNAARTLSETGSQESRLLPEGTVMVCCIGSLGKVGIAGRTVASNQQINSVIFDPKIIWPRFGFYACRLLKSRLETLAPATTVPIVNKSKFGQLEILVPPIEEQKRIADILDRAEALRAKRRAALAQLDELTQSIFLDMFGDPATNPKEWPITPMASLFAESPVFGTMIPPSVDNGKWLSLRVANIQEWQLDLKDKKYVDLPEKMVRRHSVVNGDLLMARAIASQEHLGKSVIVYPQERKWAFDSHLMRLRFDKTKAEPEFIRCLLMTPGGRSLFLKASRRSAVQFNINTKEISELQIPVPSIPLQQEFALRIEDVEELKKAHKASLAELDELFASLQYRAFRGEL